MSARAGSVRAWRGVGGTAAGGVQGREPLSRPPPGAADVTYLSPDGRLRLSRGNKGTLFVLQKDVSAKDRLLEALAARRRDDDLIAQLAEEVEVGREAGLCPGLCVGAWAAPRQRPRLGAVGALTSPPTHAAPAAAPGARRRRAAAWRSLRPTRWLWASGGWCGRARARVPTRCKSCWPTRCGLGRQCGGAAPGAAEQTCCARISRCAQHPPPLCSALHPHLHSQVENFQIISADGRLENLVQLGGGARVRACAAAAPEASDGGMRTGVEIDEVGAGGLVCCVGLPVPCRPVSVPGSARSRAGPRHLPATRPPCPSAQVLLELGSLKVPLSLRRDARGFVEWQYLDRDLRISRGNRGSTFIHVRERA